jgi:hypothetical protein
VPQVGIINPSEMSVGNSIEMAVWAAVGGRATLIGPIIGAFAVNGGKSWLTVAAPEYWLYVLGALFIVVTLFLPGGLIGCRSSFASGVKAQGADASQRTSRCCPGAKPRTRCADPKERAHDPRSDAGRRAAPGLQRSAKPRCAPNPADATPVWRARAGEWM